MLKKLTIISLVALVGQSCTVTPNYLNGVNTVELTGNEKTGTVCRFLGIGNGSVNKAAQNGGIKSVKVVNQSIYPLTICTQVVGN